MQIKNIHALVLKGIDDVEAGRYRRENVVIAGAHTTPPRCPASAAGDGRADPMT
jgi:hypothetical protein